MQTSYGIFDAYRKCTLCPRGCAIDRYSARGACGADAELTAARAALHHWEEPCISGERGSGAVFFSGCPLRCVFCQNREISALGRGYPITSDALAEIFLSLQNEKNANNINLVTAQHFIPHVTDALERAKARGLSVPIVYNSSGYESLEALRMLDGLIDVYLPDMKYYSPELAAKYSRARDYFEVAATATDEMFRQVGKPAFADGTGKTEADIMTRGVIVRHLVLPTHTDDSRKVVKYLFERFGHGIFISLMNQYTPISGAPLPFELTRGVTEEEYASVVDYAIELGVENGFIQEGGTVAESFVPLWNGEGIV